MVAFGHHLPEDQAAKTRQHERSRSKEHKAKEKDSKQESLSLLENKTNTTASLVCFLLLRVYFVFRPIWQLYASPTISIHVHLVLSMRWYNFSLLRIMHLNSIIFQAKAGTSVRWSADSKLKLYLSNQAVKPGIPIYTPFNSCCHSVLALVALIRQ